MTSRRKLYANRANARASTGPRTVAGKESASRNALRHGLRSPISADPVLAADIESLAREIAGAGASTEQREIAVQIAEAQIDLKRVRRVRHDLLARTESDNNYKSSADETKRLKVLVHLARTIGFDALIPEDYRELFAALQGPDKVATILSDLARQLGRWTVTNVAPYRGANSPSAPSTRRALDRTDRHGHPARLHVGQLPSIRLVQPPAHRKRSGRPSTQRTTGGIWRCRCQALVKHPDTSAQIS